MIEKLFMMLLYNILKYFMNLNIDMLQKLASIAGSLSLVVAIASYYYTKKQDKVLATIDQITFFREIIIPKWDEVSKLIKKKNPNFLFSRIKIDEFNIDYIKKHFSRNFNNQLSIFFNASGKDPGEWIDNSILDHQIFLLNMLEEFALKVKHLKTQNHPALSSVHSTFVEVVEKNSVSILFMRDIWVGNSIYVATLSLYSSWKNKVQKSNIVDNLEKFGFINNNKKAEILKIRGIKK